ncbi:MAG TPA: MBL fold metallo-hydrolase [Thermotogota bacterium]|nr:MBL fold metallo-hydrolase [Thermotogota bacterium]HPJ88387.1 MBL fold metallo-hydrolase [Thermotogota bacterium]HPR95445.1 MBL fold metallo-hydrolase [Thermotogota bacterium]
MEILTFSKAMYSTWLYYAPDRILFDCGEGISTLLTNKLFAVKKIFLTHSHADHISGLWGFLNTRSSAMGEREKPLEIYYHKSSDQIRNYIEFILKTGNKLKYDLSIHEIDTGEEIPLTEGNGKRYIKAFNTDHMKSEVSIGYQIRETRKRLKEDYKGLDQEAIKQIIKEKGRDAITERYSYSLMTLSGDGNVIGDEYMSDTTLLIHECTFLDAEDRRGDKHTEITELLDKIRRNKPKKVILYHISNRYLIKLRETMKNVEKELKEEGIEFFYVYPGKVCRF